MTIAQIEHQVARMGWILGGGMELVNAARSEMASLKPGDERGQFVKVEGERIRASERKPRKKAEPGADQPRRRRRWPKSQASIISEQTRAAGGRTGVWLGLLAFLVGLREEVQRLLVQGETESPFLPGDEAELVTAEIPGNRLVEVLAIGHVMHLANPDGFLAALCPFLAAPGS